MVSFRNDALNAHNQYRSKHGAPPLKWSSKLESSAQRWANQLAKKGYLQHDKQQVEGENLACMKGSELTGQKTVDMWYEEVKDYNFSRPGFSSKTGHFTQVVWASTTQVGVAKAVGSNGMQFVVARYLPPGNVLRQFDENVFQSGSSPFRNGNNTSNRNNDSRSNGGNRNAGRRPDPTSPPAGKQSNSEFKKSVLRTHNQYRKRHGAVALKWSNKLEEKAREAAEDASRTNTLRSVDMSNVGQNMAAMTGGELTGEKVSSMWYEEEGSYNYNNPGFSSSTGSFTQMVWKGSTEVGIGRAFGKSGQTYVIALYQPPGNIRGKYENNVDRPSGPLPGGERDQGCKCIIL